MIKQPSGENIFQKYKEIEEEYQKRREEKIEKLKKYLPLIMKLDDFIKAWKQANNKGEKWAKDIEKKFESRLEKKVDGFDFNYKDLVKAYLKDIQLERNNLLKQISEEKRKEFPEIPEESSLLIKIWKTKEQLDQLKNLNSK